LARAGHDAPCKTRDVLRRHIPIRRDYWDSDRATFPKLTGDPARSATLALIREMLTAYHVLLLGCQRTTAAMQRDSNLAFLKSDFYNDFWPRCRIL
jgi:hypothetical protein